MAQNSEIEKRIDRLLKGGCSLYNTIRDDLANQPPPWGYSLRHAESMKSLQDNVNTLAIMATFLAGVQAQVNTYSIGTNSTGSEVAVNVIFFIGLFLDIFSACTAYAVSVELQNTNSILLRRATSVSQINSALEKSIAPPSSDSGSTTSAKISSLCSHIRSLEIMLLHAVNTKHAWEKVFLEVRKCSIQIPQLSPLVDELDILEYTNTANELDKSRSRISIAISSIPVIRLVVLGGVTCLVVGLLLFGKTWVSGPLHCMACTSP